MGWRKDTVVSVRIPKETHAKLAKLKKETGIPIVFLMEKAVEKYLERLEAEHD